MRSVADSPAQITNHQNSFLIRRDSIITSNTRD
jgi:hypothetical protein